MADREPTPPPASAAAVVSSSVTPVAKRVRTTSPPKDDVVAPAPAKGSTIAATPEKNQDTQAPQAVSTENAEEDEEEDDLEAVSLSHNALDQFVIVSKDGGDADSAFGTDNSDSTSITSSIYDGYIENGRRYQSKREGEYWSPADEKQVGHAMSRNEIHL